MYSTNCSSACSAITSSPVITGLPNARARRINGVLSGIATTSNTRAAAAMAFSENASSSASGPPAMPIGVTFTSMGGHRSPSSGTQR
ncbi:hypothetical protein D3C71_1683300 [compost metagenome]